MKLAELLSETDPRFIGYPKEAVLIYENKADQSVKEFVVPKGDFGIKHIFEAAQLIVDSIKAQTPPECNVTMGGCAKCKGYENG